MRDKVVDIVNQHDTPDLRYRMRREVSLAKGVCFNTWVEVKQTEANMCWNYSINNKNPATMRVRMPEAEFLRHDPETVFQRALSTGARVFREEAAEK